MRKKLWKIWGVIVFVLFVWLTLAFGYGFPAEFYNYRAGTGFNGLYFLIDILFWVTVFFAPAYKHLRMKSPKQKREQDVRQQQVQQLMQQHQQAVMAPQPPPPQQQMPPQQ